MERKECEVLIFNKLREIKDIYLKYNPKGDYLDLNIIKDEDGISFCFNNKYFDEGEDKQKPINFYKHENKG